MQALMRSIDTNKKSWLVFFTICIFCFYFSLDSYYFVWSTSLLNTFMLFDFSSVYYSAREVANGQPLLSRHIDYYGLPTYACHAFFLKILGMTPKALRYGIAFASCCSGILTFFLLREVISTTLAFLLTLALWPNLSGFAFGYNAGYAAIYIFFILNLGLYCSLLSLRFEIIKKYLVSILGILGGTAFAFKYELGSVVLCTFFQILFLQLAVNTNPNQIKKNWILKLLAGATIGLLIISIKVNLFGYGFLPIVLFWLSTIFWAKNFNIEINKFLRCILFFVVSALIALAPWILLLQQEAGISFALKQYFPTTEGITEQIGAMQAHGGFITSPFFYFKTAWQILLSGRINSFLYISVSQLFLAIAAYFYLKNQNNSKNIKLITMWVFTASTFVVFLRDPNCPIYHTYGMLVGHLIFAFYLLKNHTQTRNLVLATTVFLLGVYGVLSWIITLKFYVPPRDYPAYSKSLNLSIDPDLSYPLDSMEDFFKRNLTQDDEIFVFSGIYMPYILANKSASNEIRMPSFLFHSEATETTLLNYLKKNTPKIKYIVKSINTDAIFSGPILDKAFSKINFWIEQNWQLKASYGFFEIYEKKPIRFE